MGRQAGPLPNLIRPWTNKLGAELYEYLRRLKDFVAIINKTPRTPTSIEAGTAASIGTLYTPSKDNHQHAVDETGSVATVAMANADGTGTGMARKTHVHATPLTTDGDLLTVIAGVLSRLGIGADGEVLSVATADPAWEAFGTQQVPIVTKTVSGYTLTDSDCIVLVNITGATRRILLPALSTVPIGKVFVLSNLATADFSIAPNGIETIDAKAIETLQGFDSIVFVSDGIAWYSIAYGSALTTVGDLMYATTDKARTRLPIGSEKDVLKVVSGLPAWATATTEKSWSFDSPAGSTGTFYWGGHYRHAATDDDFTTPPTYVPGTRSHAAHAFFVLGVQTVDVLTLRVTGTSTTDAGVRTTSDTEDIVIANATAVGTYFETSKKWIGGTTTITVVSGTAKLCNYGTAKYWDNGNTDFKVVGLEATWLAGATDTSADIQLIHHKATGWTYNAGAAATPPAAIVSLVGDHSTDAGAQNGFNGAWKRTNLTTSVAGSASEGVIWVVVTTANKAFELGNLILSIQEG